MGVVVKRKNKKKRAGGPKPEVVDAEMTMTPKCFVIKRGNLGGAAKILASDLRRVMSPWCAAKLRESKKNRLRDFVSVASHFGVKDIQIITQTDNGVYLRIGHLPSGPTLRFRVDSFSLQRDIRATQKRPRATKTDYQFSPLVVLKGFRDRKERQTTRDNRNNPESLSESSATPPLDLVSTIFTNMFPPIDVNSLQVGRCRRVVLFEYQSETNTVKWRHYAVIKKPCGMTRGVTKLVRWNNGKTVDLGRKNDVSDFILSGDTGGASDSEQEDLTPVQVPAGTRIALAQSTNQIGIRLVELGPRLNLTLLKAEEELCTGTVLYQLGMNPAQSQQHV